MHPARNKVDLAFGDALQDDGLDSLAARRILKIRDVPPGIRIAWIDQQSDDSSPRDQLGNKLKPFGCQLEDEKADAGNIAAWPG